MRNRYVIRLVVKDNKNGIELGDSTEIETTMSASKLIKDTMKYLKMKGEKGEK